MNTKILNTIERYSEEYGLILENEKIVVGLSGGADSVFLLLVLSMLQKKWKLQIQAVHINHGIRGSEAKRDEEFCLAFSEKLGIKCHVYHKNIPEAAKEWGMTEEEAGRKYRYECFENIRRREEYDVIAVAHHQDDQAETILFQMLRGSGLRGLGGMRPKREKIIRPLLCVTRMQIEKELKSENISYCQDSTNEELIYKRNIIRHEILPLMTQQIQPLAVSHITQSGRQLQEVMEYLEIECDEHFQRMVKQEKDSLFLLEKDFKILHKVMQKELILKMMEKLVGQKKDITAKHIENTISVFGGPTGKEIYLPYHMIARKSYDKLSLLIQKEESMDHYPKSESSLQIEFGKEYELTGIDCNKMFFHFWKEKKMNLSEKCLKNYYTKCFDYDKMDGMPVFRHPLPGDFLWIDNQGKRKKLSRLFIDMKIPIEQREKIYVLAEQNHIIWIPVLGRSSNYYYISDTTKCVMMAEMSEKTTK